MVRLLDRNAVASVLTMSAAIETAKAAFTALEEGRTVMPQRLATRVERHRGTHLSMPCFVGGEKEILSIKVVSVFERNQPDHGLPTISGFVLLHNAETGELVSLMDAEYLTAMRTGAASAVATDLLAVADASVATIFGAGTQAEMQLAGIAQVRPLGRVYVVDPYAARAHAFAARNPGLDVVVATDVRQAVRGSQIICTATNSVAPVFDGLDLQPGTHLNAIGAFREDMRELDDEALCRSRIYVDKMEAAQKGAGDLIQAVAGARLSWESVAGELGAMLTGKVQGRTDREEITVFKSVGLAVQDAFAASWVFEQAVQRDLGLCFALS